MLCPYRSGRDRRDAGFSLIEAMISMVILTIGMLGSLQGILIATHQNAVAQRLARADAIASRIRTALQREGGERLSTAANIPLGGKIIPAAFSNTAGTTYGWCGTSTSVRTAGLKGLTGACDIDLDASDTTNALVAGYAASDAALFHRALVVFPMTEPDTTTALTGVMVAVVVSFPDGTGTRTVKQFVTLYNRAVNGTAFEL